jgi:hypothetical protein
MNFFLQTVNQAFYLQILKYLSQCICQKGPYLWLDRWILHHDKAPYHTELSVVIFRLKIPLEHPPYLLVLVCDSLTFPKLKLSFIGSHFESLEDLQSNMMTIQKGHL